MKACRNIKAEIFIVDNNSTDGSVDYLEAKFPSVKFLINSVNTGFAKANNQAVTQATGDYILFLNPDTILSEDSLEKSLAFFGSHPEAGAMGIHMIDGAGCFLKESKRAFPSPATSFNKLSGLALLFPKSKLFNRYYLGHLAEKENHEVDVLAGAFMMIPKKLLDQVGSFDETFFMYGEDVDLSYRIQKAGYRNYYFAESSIIHFKGESTKKGSLNYIHLFYNAMSLFVKKHYSGGSAGLFNFFVQIAIWIRASFSAIGKLVKSVGLPLIDAVVILLSFWITKLWWASFVKKEANYSPNVLLIAFPVFTLIFMVAAYFSGLYDKGYKQEQLNRSTSLASLVLLSSYLLLPDELRFSRGILIFGIVTAFLITAVLRQLFVKANLISNGEDLEEQQTVVVSSEKDFSAISELMRRANMQERVLGRVNNRGNEKNSLGNLDQLPELLKKYAIKEVIFCEDGLSYKEIIDRMQTLPANVRFKFHSSGSSSIVGSESKDNSGESISVDKKYIIAWPLNKRKKRLLDVLLSLLLIGTSPLHLLLQKKRMGFLKNVFSVLAGNKTLVGYAGDARQLPKIRQGILTSTSLPAAMNNLPAESLIASDEWYATGYSTTVDLEKIRRGYRYLGE